jgi:polar amino acid transport system substrate-binding protein
MGLWMLSFARRSAAILGLSLLLLAHAFAQEPPKTINAAVVPPFVMEGDGKLTSFSIDLWKEIAVRLNLTTNYEQTRDMNATADALRSKMADVAVTPIDYTSERDREFDFSHPTLEVGLQIMVRDTGAGPSSTPLHDVLALLFSRSALM